jgi:hypothetical protein
MVFKYVRFKNVVCPVKVNGMWRIRTDQELMNLHREPDIISDIAKYDWDVRTLKNARRKQSEGDG